MFDVHPHPSDEELAAIMSAVALLWPKPQTATTPEPPMRWRFAGRPWQGRPSYGGWR
jgi:hypothetical protein